MPAKKPPVKRMSHEERNVRRQRMAESVRKGRTPASVAAKEGVTLYTVYMACRMFDVQWPTAGK